MDMKLLKKLPKIIKHWWFLNFTLKTRVVPGFMLDDEIVRMIRACLAETNSTLPNLFHEGCLWFLVYHKRRVIGFKALKHPTPQRRAWYRMQWEQDIDDLPVVEMGYTYIHKDYRRRGISSHMTHMILCVQGNNKEHPINLVSVTRITNYQAQNGLIKMGFSRVGTSLSNRHVMFIIRNF